MLTELLIKTYIRNPEKTDHPAVRLRYGLLAGYTGVAVNALLFILKFVIGFISGSMAITADAANNIADAGSAIVTAIGFNIAAHPADKDHPFGHGRVEYVAGVIVSVFIMAFGITFLRESISSFFHPRELSVSNTLLAILAGSLFFKLWLFFFYRKIGKSINSDVIRAAAFDSLSDIVCTSAVLGTSFAGRFTKLPLDAIAGTVIAILVIIGAIKLLKETINPLLGERPSEEMVQKLRECLLQCKGIKGVHDIIIHNYGHDQYFATAHAEVDPDGTLMSAHDMLESAEIHVAKRMPVRLLLHCDPCNTSDPEIIRWRGKMEEIVSASDEQFKLYDFRLKHSEDGKLQLHFHLLIPRNYPIEPDDLHKMLSDRMHESSPEVELVIEFINSYV